MINVLQGESIYGIGQVLYKYADVWNGSEYRRELKRYYISDISIESNSSCLMSDEVLLEVKYSISPYIDICLYENEMVYVEEGISTERVGLLGYKISKDIAKATELLKLERDMKSVRGEL